jgi:hypothetical protein
MLSSKVGVFLQTRGMHTLIRDKEISKHDFVFYSDRLIRLVGNALYKISEFTVPANKLILLSLDFTGSGTWSWLLAIYRETSYNTYRSV